MTEEHCHNYLSLADSKLFPFHVQLEHRNSNLYCIKVALYVTDLRKIQKIKLILTYLLLLHH